MAEERTKRWTPLQLGNYSTGHSLSLIVKHGAIINPWPFWIFLGGMKMYKPSSLQNKYNHGSAFEKHLPFSNGTLFQLLFFFFVGCVCQQYLNTFMLRRWFLWHGILPFRNRSIDPTNKLILCVFDCLWCCFLKWWHDDILNFYVGLLDGHFQPRWPNIWLRPLLVMGLGVSSLGKEGLSTVTTKIFFA